MKCVSRAWGELKRGCEVLALGVKCVLTAWGELKKGFEVLALCETCLRGMGAVEKGV